jgi:hypothetical protein
MLGNERVVELLLEWGIISIDSEAIDCCYRRADSVDRANRVDDALRRIVSADHETLKESGEDLASSGRI